jgi:hypothetical protein
MSLDSWVTIYLESCISFAGLTKESQHLKRFLGLNDSSEENTEEKAHIFMKGKQIYKDKADHQRYLSKRVARLQEP